MTLQEVYRMIELQPEMITRLNSAEQMMDLKDFEIELQKMMIYETAGDAYRELQEKLGEDPGNIKMLLCQLECARRQHDTNYARRGISDKIFADTMKCFTRFNDECLVRNGKMYFDRGWWTYRQISMDLFRVGELEYQFESYNGEALIELHIPSNAALTPENVEASFKQSVEFLEQHFPEYSYNKYMCCSWLLSSRLGEILNEGSNILDFQRRFTLTENYFDNRDYYVWLFKKNPDTPIEELPTGTSLQRKAIAMEKEGRLIGESRGFIYL